MAAARGNHDPARTAVRHGTEKGAVSLGGRRVPVSRPRARTVDGHVVLLQSYVRFATGDVLSRWCWSRCSPVSRPPGSPGSLARRHSRPRQGRCRGRSAVSRQFVKQTETGLAELPARDPTAKDIQGLMLGGEFMAGWCVTVRPRRHRRG